MTDAKLPFNFMKSFKKIKTALPKYLRKKTAAEFLFLAVLLTTCFFLFNQLNFSENRWSLHPDDQNILVFSKVLSQTGTLWFQSPYNEDYDVQAFIPAVNDYENDSSKEGKIRAAYAPGIYFLVAPGHYLGMRGPFFIIAFIGMAGVLFFYLFVRELFGVPTAMVATLFFSLSPAYVYWSNMLYTNIPALCFTMAGVYFITQVIKKPERKTFYFLAVASFVLAVWMRGDYLFLVGIIIICVLVGYHKSLKWLNIIWSVAFLLAFGGMIALVNYLVAGSIVGIAPKGGTQAHASEVFVKYAMRMFQPEVLLSNARLHIYALVPLLIILGLFGVIYCIREGLWKNPILVAFFLSAVFLFIYYGKNKKFWGFNKSWLAASYTRYFLPIFMVLSVFAAVFIVNWLLSISPKKLAVVACVMVLAIQTLISINILTDTSFSLSYTEKWNAASKSVDRFAASLPEGTVVVNFAKDGFYRKMICSRTVFSPASVQDEEKMERSTEIIIDLVRRGIPVYIINNKDREIVEIDKWDQSNEAFELLPIEHDIHFEVGARDPDLFVVNLIPEY